MFFIFFLVSLLFLLSLLITPIAGGCILLSLIMIVYFIVLVLFSINFTWILLTIVSIYLLVYLNKLYKWLKLPTYEEYIKLNNNICCSRCGSDNLQHLGLFYPRSKWRFYICRTCGNILYRFKLL
jgi:hypothetical protein